MRAFAEASRAAIQAAGVAGEQVQSLALDTTGSSVVPVVNSSSPLTNITCGATIAPGGSHRNHKNRPGAKIRAPSIGAAASIPPSGDPPSSFTGFAITPKSGLGSLGPSNTATWSPPSSAASPIPARIPRSICAMGHKWMWSAASLACRPNSFLTSVDPS